ncbi:MAG: PAS domain S-box protein [Syntrophobacterales bacterium]|jgi:PAS domain S-box-containing protein
MAKPTYEELQRRVEELEKRVNIQISPEEFYFETKDLINFKGYRDWSVDFFDRKIEDLTGYKLEDFLDRKIKWFDLVLESDKSVARETIRQALKTDKYYLDEYRIVKKQGDLKWIKIRGHITCDDSGEFLFVRGVLNDITLEKYGQPALEPGTEDFAWANNLKDGIYVVSKDYRIEFMNQPLIDLVGNHMGEVCYEALFGRDTVCPWSLMDEIKHESCCFLQEYHLPKTGKIFQVRSFPYKGKDGSIGKLGHLLDITQTRNLEREVEELAARQKAIEDAATKASLGIFILQDYEGVEARFRYINEAFARITGYKPSELLEMSLADLVHPHSRQAVFERYRDRKAGEILNRSYEIKMVRKDGKVFTVSKTFALSSYDGELATIGFLQDITENKRVQKALWRSQRLASIGRLAAEIAHEMNNPLTSVLTFCKLANSILQQKPFPTERLTDLRDFISYLHSETERCANISRNLLDFSRQSEIEIRENDIHEILDKTLAILRHRAGLDEIEIDTSYADKVPFLSCDFKRLQQAFINILWNAIEAMPGGGRLTVSTGFDKEKDRVEIRISDTGVGISEEDLEKIFEPFFTTKAEGKGSGLGLSVAYGIIRQHRGEIQFLSKEGEGTDVIVHLPLGPLTLSIEGKKEQDYVFAASDHYQAGK